MPDLLKGPASCGHMLGLYKAAMERSAVAYISNMKLIIAPVICTSEGVRLEIDPIRLDGPWDKAAIWVAIVAALENSQRIISPPPQNEWKDFFRAFQDAAGVRSLKAFMKDAKCVGIDAVGDQIRLTPHQNLGPNAGFEELPEEAVTLSFNDAERSVSALHRLLFGTEK